MTTENHARRSVNYLKEFYQGRSRGSNVLGITAARKNTEANDWFIKIYIRPGSTSYEGLPHTYDGCDIRLFEIDPSDVAREDSINVQSPIRYTPMAITYANTSYTRASATWSTDVTWTITEA